jgi:hypothetical protein
VEAVVVEPGDPLTKRILAKLGVGDRVQAVIFA